MIKLNDLRVGNCVNFKTKEGYKAFPVNKIDASCGTCEFVYCEGYISVHIYVNEFYDLEPIPLTEDILLKCGFETNCDDGFLVYKMDVKGNYGHGFDISLVEDKSGDVFNYVCWDINCGMKYVHELQNFYHALTGKELDIKL